MSVRFPKNQFSHCPLTGSAAPVDTSIFDPLRDAQLERQAEIDKEWETLMVSGPLVVEYIGTLMAIASNKDFAFRPPSSGFIYQYMKCDKIAFA